MENINLSEEIVLDNMEIQPGILKTGKMKCNQEVHLDEYGEMEDPVSGIVMGVVRGDDDAAIECN